ncbi:MAG: hypothetical protein PWR09_416 [Archaeoglobi archaeon]|nr:hypothetical protein [Archaeoglobi archaeon]
MRKVMGRESLILTLFAGISSVAVSMMLPYIPLFAQESGLSLELIGYVVFTYYIVQVIMRIPIGSLSDALGDDRIILMGAISMLISPFFYLLSLRHPASLFIAQALLGIGHSVTWVTSPSLITKFRGPLHLYTFFMGLGWFLGPPFGGKLRDLFGMLPLFIALFLLSLSSLIFAVILRRRMKVERRVHGIRKIAVLGLKSLGEALKLMRKREIFIASYISFIMFMSFGLGASLLPLYLSEIGLSSFLIGVATSVRMGVSKESSHPSSLRTLHRSVNSSGFDDEELHSNTHTLRNMGTWSWNLSSGCFLDCCRFNRGERERNCNGSERQHGFSGFSSWNSCLHASRRRLLNLLRPSDFRTRNSDSIDSSNPQRFNREITDAVIA